MSGLRQHSRAPAFLLDLDIGGAIIRASYGVVDGDSGERLTGPIEVTDDSGASHYYPSGLAELVTPGVVEDIVTSYRVTMTVDFDWAEHEARGGTLNDREAVLRLWFPGQTLEKARVLVRGVTEGAGYGLKGEALAISIVNDHTLGASVLPPPGAAVSSETWPVSTPNYAFASTIGGVGYNMVIGYPGHHLTPGAAADIPEPAVPALFVEREDPNISSNDFWHIALGAIDAAKVNLWNMSVWPPEDSETAAGGSTVSETDDKLGRKTSGLRTIVLTEEGDEYWVGLQRKSGYGGGIQSKYGTHVMNGAGEVIQWVYEHHSNVTIDKGRMRAAWSYLNRYLVDTWWNESVNMVQWLHETILKDLPVVGVQGPRGFYFAPMRWGATSVNQTARLNITTDGENGAWKRSGGLVSMDEPIVNALTCNYRWVQSRRFVSTRTLTAQGQTWTDSMGRTGQPALPWYATSADDRILGDGLAAKSQAQFGQRQWTLNCKWTFDDNTGVLLLHDKLLRNGWPKRVGRAIGSVGASEIRPGDIVLVDDEEMYLSDRVALVLSTPTSVDEVAVDYVLLDHPFNVQRRIV